MVKITAKIDGMMCGMCETHINDAIRNAFKVKKVKSSHSKGTAEIIAENEISLDEISAVIEKTGYHLLRLQTEPYEKKGFRLFGR